LRKAYGANRPGTRLPARRSPQKEIAMADHNVETRDRSEEARNRPIEINAKRARGGLPGVPVLYVLIAATALIVVAFLVIYFVFLKVAP
jgi:hypothetical protein